jgi:nitroreductase
MREMAALDIEEGFKEILDYQEHPDTPECDPSAFERVVQARRSTRVFDQTVPVPEEVIDRSLDLAMLSPNSSNLQPWEFHWVQSPEKKEQLTRWCMSQPAARTASDLIVFVARTKTWKRNSDAIHQRLSADPTVPESALKYYRLLCPLVYTQAWNLFSLMKYVIFNGQGLFKPMPRQPNFNTGMRMWAAKSVSLAASTFMLSISAHGYDSCAMEGFDEVRVKRLLDLPRDARVVMVIGVGKRADNGVYGKRLRLDRSWFVRKV